MSKRFLQIFIVCIAVFAFASVSMAQSTYEVNIYGASAQYLFWHDMADDYLVNVQGCPIANISQAETSDGKHGITRGTNCGTNGDTWHIRYSSMASFDGIYACKGQVPPAEVGGQPTCSSVGPQYRSMADPNKVTFGSSANNPSTSLSCYLVDIGASDVAGDTFGQISHGQKKGHLGGGWVDRNVQAIDTTGMTYARPVVVPFGFFANTSLDPNVVTNLTRLQAVLIYSVNALTWDQFGTSYPAKDIIACLRHAGSGTHATLDAVIMRNDTWPLATYEDAGYVWFNDGSSDMMRCVDQNGGNSADSAAAIGYADADQLVGSSYANVYALDYQGASPSKSNITNGVYDFWSTQWCYNCTSNSAFNSLMSYASNPANLPASKAAYWATANEMKVEKTNDRAYPKFI
ncbi:hypothetical protein JXL19_08985 [bacterium]|nr:hypothetical protein [bacterium]